MAQRHVYTITRTRPAAYVTGTPSLNPLSPSPTGREFKLLTDNSHTPRLSHSFPSPDQWTCHSQVLQRTHAWRTVRVSAVCPYLSLKLPSYICNCLLENVNTYTICFATSMDKRAHTQKKKQKKGKKTTLCTLRETRTKQVNIQNPGLLSSSSSKINETLSFSRKLLTS